jgi:hypothetical protein
VHAATSDKSEALVRQPRSGGIALTMSDVTAEFVKKISLCETDMGVLCAAFVLGVLIDGALNPIPFLTAPETGAIAMAAALSAKKNWEARWGKRNRLKTCRVRAMRLVELYESEGDWQTAQRLRKAVRLADIMADDPDRFMAIIKDALPPEPDSTS